MKWDPRIPKAPPRDREPWTTQEQEWKAWMGHVGKRPKANTRRNLTVYPAVFLRMFHPALVSHLGEDDAHNFVDAIEPKCNSYMASDPPTCRRGLDVATCPMQTGQPLTSCVKYHALRPRGVLAYLDTINQMYEWMREQQRLPGGSNPMLPVVRAYREKHRAILDQLADHPNRRDLTIEEVRALVKKSPPGHAIVYFMAGKFFLRIHEALRMSFDPQYCNLKEGWMLIPAGLPGEPHKRRGNHTVILDREAKNYISAYKASYWEPNVRKDDDGVPVTQRIALTDFGLPYRGRYAEGNFNREALQKDALRLEIMDGDEERGERVTTHAFRSFALSYANDRGCPQIDGWILMGDKVGGPAGSYDNYRPRLAGLYHRFGPVLDIQ
ncbi:MAG TPA: hypothetical protein VM286_08645 [Candidatus Thermoplasmatota archaeon]|nr:hypothetical protein [Candidatus Thermoplasmatota archaeon]